MKGRWRGDEREGEGGWKEGGGRMKERRREGLIKKHTAASHERLAFKFAGGVVMNECSRCCCGVVVVLWWCCGGVVVVLWWCYGGVVVVLWWCCGGVVVVLWWCCGGVVVVLWWCCGGVVVI